MEIMKQTGIIPSVIRAGKANMFLSPIFRETLAGVTGATIELYNTDGSQGAALGAGVGAGLYRSFKEAFTNLKKLETGWLLTSQSPWFRVVCIDHAGKKAWSNPIWKDEL